MAGTLNTFQRAMLQWNDLHPYNAVHVVRVAAPLELERLRATITGTLETCGLTGLDLDAGRGTYHYRGGPAACEIKTLDGMAALDAEIERQLNTAFSPGKNFNPFRFFVVPGPDVFLLGLVYFHAVADAEAIARLMRDLYLGYLAGGRSPDAGRLELHPRHHASLLTHPGLLAGKIAALPRHLRSMRTTRRLNCRGVQDLSNAFTFFTLDAGQLKALSATTKAWEITLNDLFLALLIQSLAGVAPWRLNDSKRPNISVGCVVNLRKELGVAGQPVFGLFLGSWLVTHELPAGTSLMSLARDVRRQTQAIKQRRLYLTPSLDMILSCFLLRRFPRERQIKFLQRHYPLWGGITNMNLNPIWERPPGEAPPDYFRAVSTGPATPLVLSATTAGDRVNLGLTYRPVFFAPADIERIKVDFLAHVNELKAGS